jgi:hypothetical protein
MRQLNGFWTWRITNSLTHVQADLYFTILACANTARWKSPLSLPNSTIMGKCEICKSDLHKNRLALVDNGLIEYSKGWKGTAGKYVIVPLYETNQRTNLETNPETNVRTNQRNISKTKTNTKPNTSSQDKSYDLEALERMIDDPDYLLGDTHVKSE